jgi:hypothetical protein
MNEHARRAGRREKTSTMANRLATHLWHTIVRDLIVALKDRTFLVNKPGISPAGY